MYRFAPLLFILFLVVFSVKSSYAHTTAFASENVPHLSFFGKLSLLPQLGIRKTLAVIMTPLEKTDRQYHAFVYDLNCAAPNYWSVGDVDNPVCSNPAAQAAGIKCGEVCPPERRVGPVCPQGHYCCRPADTPPVGTSKPTPVRSPCSDGAGHTLQYCDIKF